MQNKTTGDAYRKNKKNKTHFLSGVSTLLDSRGRFVFWSNVQESKEKKEKFFVRFCPRRCSSTPSPSLSSFSFFLLLPFFPTWAKRQTLVFVRKDVSIHPYQDTRSAIGMKMRKCCPIGETDDGTRTLVSLLLLHTRSVGPLFFFFLFTDKEKINVAVNNSWINKCL